MQGKKLAILLTLIAPAIALAQGAQSYQCTYGDLERRVEILYETSESGPCEVHYYKDSESPGDRQVLWSASNESGYCEARTEEFIAKLEGWGWDCDQSAAAEPEAEPEAPPEEADDTDALSSGDESGEGDTQ